MLINDILSCLTQFELSYMYVSIQIKFYLPIWSLSATPQDKSAVCHDNAYKNVSRISNTKMSPLTKSNYNESHPGLRETLNTNTCYSLFAGEEQI